MWRMSSSMIARRTAMAMRSSMRQTAAVPRAMPRMLINATRCYSVASLSKDDVQQRVFNVFKAFDKVGDSSKLTPTAKFSTDLGLDSLDTVEVMVAVEEEFGIEIPDEQADEIKSIDDAINYILAQPEAR